jgi:beta-glucosidase
MRKYLRFILISLFFVPSLLFAQLYKDPTALVEDRVEDLLSIMTLAEKVGQMTQAERNHASPEDVKNYFLGSILNGGGSVPGNNTPEEWADMIDAYQTKALETRLQIPFIYGTDAVHGHNNLKGATVFPHNVGLGAMRDPDLMEEIAEVTALEVSASGVDWTFGPTLCVSRDERWGRAYECFGELPDIGVSYSDRFVNGLQGTSMSGEHIVATTKHWVGDGGTLYGTGDKDNGYYIDRGDTPGSDIVSIHKPPYLPAIQEGVGSVMISFSSVDGKKMHQHLDLITNVLKNELGFDGFVISDWDGITEIPAASYREQVKIGVNAGIDMMMVPSNWQQFIGELSSLVQSGEVAMSRIDDSVRRILRIKFRAGLFEEPFADRTHLNDGTIGSEAHRAVAREAVRKSLVLLKNKNNILPLSKTADIFVAGSHANNIGLQCGGWTITWQGKSGNITAGTTILQGIQAAAYGNVTFSENGLGAAGHDVAVVAVGEDPYAEGWGDYPSKPLTLSPSQLSTLQNVRNAGVPVVLVLVSGRPLLIESELGDWDALVAAWLPGTEGNGVADVLFGDYAPTGKLPVSWPKNLSQIPINAGDADYDPLFAYNFGVNYAGPSDTTIPFEGAAYSLPGTVQAENFDIPWTQSSYHDTTTGNAGGAYRTDVDVDIESALPSGFNVGWTASGEWLEYTVNVATAGTYSIGVRYASKSSGGNYHIEFNGINVTGTTSVGATGGWQNWTTSSHTGIYLSAGEQTMRFVFDSAGLNIDSVTVSGGTGGIPATTTFQAENHDDMEGIEVDGSYVGWFDGGDWLRFNNINFGSGVDSFRMNAAVDPACAGKKMELRIDGINGPVIGSITFDNTGAWDNFQQQTSSISGTTGIHDLYLFGVSGWGIGNIDWFTFTKETGGCTQEPFGGAAVVLPGTVEAENYDTCGEGVAYHDTTTGNAGRVYRSDDVDIEAATPSGYNVGYIEAGEWLAFTVNVTAAGNYDIGVRYASESTGGNYHIEFNGINATGTTNVDATGGWQNWTTNSHTEVYLSAGVQTMRFVFDSAGLNIDAVTISEGSGGIPAATTFQAENYDDMDGIEVDGRYIGWFDGGDWLRFDNINFGSGVDSFRMNAAVDPACAGQKMELRIDGINGSVIGSITFNNTGAWDNFQPQTTSIPGTTGVHDLYLVGVGGWGIGNIDWFAFQ